MASSDTDHYPYIDALRGWAILLVVAVHVGQESFGPLWLRNVASAGNFGVQLFFVLSALTLFLSMKARMGRDRYPVAAFFVRRFFRIAPLFWLAIPVYAPYAIEAGAIPSHFSPEVLATLLFVHGWHPLSINSAVPGGWSIAVETTFYALLPALFGWLGSLKRVLLALGLAIPLSLAISIAARKLLDQSGQFDVTDVTAFTFYWFPRQAPIFLLGGLLYHLLRTGYGPSTPQGRALHVWGTVLVLGLLSLVHSRIPLAYLVFSLGWVVLIFGLARYPATLFVNALTRYYGKISYSAYLTHFLVVWWLREPLAHGVETLGMAKESILAFAVMYLGSVLGTALLATATYHLVEVPGQKLGRAIIERRGLGPARVAATAA